MIPPTGGVPSPGGDGKATGKPLRIVGFTLLVIALVVLGLLLFTHAF